MQHVWLVLFMLWSKPCEVLLEKLEAGAGVRWLRSASLLDVSPLCCSWVGGLHAFMIGFLSFTMKVK